MQEAGKVRQERLDKVKRDKEAFEAEKCTFKPAVKKCPSYVLRMAKGSRNARMIANQRQGGWGHGQSSGRSSTRHRQQPQPQPQPQWQHSLLNKSTNSRQSAAPSTSQQESAPQQQQQRRRRRHSHSSAQGLFDRGSSGPRGYTHNAAGGPPTSRTYESDSERPQWK